MSQLISICIPVYNGEAFFGDTLRSLLSQTYENFELIVSDNASTDRTLECVEKIAKSDPRVRILKSDKNYGYCKNIEKAVLAARSNIICVFHADDIYEPSMVSRQYETLVANDVSAVFVRTDTFSDSLDSRSPNPVYDELRENSVYSKDRKLFIGGIDGFGPVLLEYGNIFACPSLMTYKDFYLSTGGYKDTYPSSEDLELWIKYLRAGKKLGIINDVLLHYRKSPTQGSHYWDNRLEIPAEFRVIDDTLIKVISPPKVTLEKYWKRKSKALLSRAILAIRKNDRAKAKELMGESRRAYRYSPFSKFGLLQLSLRVDVIFFRRLQPLIMDSK